MARARNIKPGFFRNADLVELSFEDRLLFIGLWTLADRDGRLEDRPKQIKMELFPADSVDCNAMLDSLAATGMVARYEVDGKRYLQVVNFGKHQNPHRDEKASTIPYQSVNLQAQDKHCANTVQAPCKPNADSVAIGLNPEPLIPDSLIPDSLTGHAVVIREDDEIQNSGVSRQAAVCMVIKSEGIGSVNPQHPDLLALIDQGADVGHFAAAAKVAKSKGKGFAYLLGIVKGQIADATLLASTTKAHPIPIPGARPQPVSFAERDRIAGMQRWEESTNQRHPDLPAEFSKLRPTADVIDITPVNFRISQ
jgi:hypothetical protein